MNKAKIDFYLTYPDGKRLFFKMGDVVVLPEKIFLTSEIKSKYFK